MSYLQVFFIAGCALLGVASWGWLIYSGRLKEYMPLLITGVLTSIVLTVFQDAVWFIYVFSSVPFILLFWYWFLVKIGYVKRVRGA